MTTIETMEAEVATEASLAERWTDRLNPILLKEVRQAMRGRYFKISFWFTLAVATIVGLSVCLVTIVDGGKEAVMGPPFFIAMFACLVLAAQVLVPFSSFLSMGGEWDENTWDLLVLSNLRPRQIVYGKVLSAGVQTLLYFSAFGPFLVFAFLLRGIDLTALLVSLAVSFVCSILLSCLAVAMSSFSRARFARVLLMVLLAAVLIGLSIGTVAWGAQMMFFPGQLHDPEVLEVIGATLTVFLAVAAFFFAAACTRLAHYEENRSTGLRLMSLLVVFCALGWMTYLQGTSPSKAPIIAATCMSFAALAISSIFFITEPERLGRRVAATIPRNPLLTWLATPFLPGGARGLLFFIASGTLVSLWMYLYPQLVNPSFKFNNGQLLIPPTLMAYGILFLGVPSALYSKRAERMLVRVLTRISIVVVFAASILFPTLFGFLMDLESRPEFDHAGNAFLMIDHLWSNDVPVVRVLLTFAAACAIGLLLNMRRLRQMVQETRSALSARSQEAA